MANLDLFHFLRPWWLAGIPMAVLIWWWVRRIMVQRTPESALFSPHLLKALMISDNTSGRVRAVDGTALALVLLALAAAGPTWSKLPSPWFSESAPLVLAMEVSDSMRSNDLQPTRLDRARFKALDLIEARTGARTALIAYAGSAHLVMPPTKDARVIKPFLEGLDPGIMPKSGASAREVLPMARDVLGDQGVVSSLVFLTDGFEAEDIEALAEFSGQPENPGVIALVFGTEQGGVAMMPDGSPVMGSDGARLKTGIDKSILGQAKTRGKVEIVYASTGDNDLARVLGAVASNLNQADDPEAIWQDQGWWLVWPGLLLVLLWFRKGWTMQW